MTADFVPQAAQNRETGSARTGIRLFPWLIDLANVHLRHDDDSDACLHGEGLEARSTVFLQVNDPWDGLLIFLYWHFRFNSCISSFLANLRRPWCR